MKTEKIGVIDVGGGLRGIYATGVFDYCMDQKISFDLGIGVSAGSANLASYAAGQKGRNYKFYTEYAFRKQYMGFGNFIRKENFVDLDYVYEVLSNRAGEYPLDYSTLRKNPIEFYVVATNAKDGQAKYFDKSDLHQDDYNILKASSAIPFACRPYEIQGNLYFDGALGDSVPFEKAFQLGCDRVVVILTKPQDVLRDSAKGEKIAAFIRKNILLLLKTVSKGAAL